MARGGEPGVDVLRNEAEHTVEVADEAVKLVALVDVEVGAPPVAG